MEKVLTIANDILKRNPSAVKDLIQLLGRKLQSDYMCRAITSLDKHRIPDLVPKQVWFDEFTKLNATGECVDDLKIKVKSLRKLNLVSDLILPWPWKIESVVSTISDIGSDRIAGEWTQHSPNHRVEYWLPFGIGWVHGGNHSIMNGIVRGEGHINTDLVYDLSPVFSQVSFNGDAFVRTSDNSIIQVAKEFEFAAIFEIGRLMHHHSLSA